IRREEESFNRTIDTGITKFEEFVDSVRRSGDRALTERLLIRRMMFNKYRCTGRSLQNRDVVTNDKIDELVTKKPRSITAVAGVLGRNEHLGPELSDQLARDLYRHIQIHTGEAPDAVANEVAFELFDTYGF